MWPAYSSVDLRQVKRKQKKKEKKTNKWGAQGLVEITVQES